MEHQGRFAVGLADRWRPAMVPAVATGLVLLGRVLMDEMGSPVTLLRALGDLGQPWTDPVASVIAVMALAAEMLVGYVLVALALGSLCMLPGSMGRLAARATSLVTPVTVRRLLDLLVDGTLLAQVALAPAPGAARPVAMPGHRWSGSHLASTFSGSVGPAVVSDPAPTSVGTGWLPWLEDQSEPVGARPNPRRSAAPLPPWLGGGPSNAAPGHGEETSGTGAPGHLDETAGTGAPGRREEVGGPACPGSTMRRAVPACPGTVRSRAAPERPGIATSRGLGRKERHGDFRQDAEQNIRLLMIEQHERGRYDHDKGQLFTYGLPPGRWTPGLCGHGRW